MQSLAGLVRLVDKTYKTFDTTFANEKQIPQEQYYQTHRESTPKSVCVVFLHTVSVPCSIWPIPNG